MRWMSWRVAVLAAVPNEAPARVDHEDARPFRGTFLVEEDHTGCDAGSVEEVRRQPDNSIDEAATDDLAADGVAPEQDSVRHDHRGLATALQAGEDMQEECIVAVPLGWQTVWEGRYSSSAGLKPLLDDLVENGGLATTQSNVLRPPVREASMPPRSSSDSLTGTRTVLTS
jgi:hypothetical protein